MHHITGPGVDHAKTPLKGPLSGPGVSGSDWTCSVSFMTFAQAPTSSGHIRTMSSVIAKGPRLIFASICVIDTSWMDEDP